MEMTLRYFFLHQRRTVETPITFAAFTKRDINTSRLFLRHLDFCVAQAFSQQDRLAWKRKCHKSGHYTCFTQSTNPNRRYLLFYFYQKLIMSELSQTADSLPAGEHCPTSPTFVGSKQDFVEKQKVKCNVNGRDIVVFYHNQQFYAMDQHCYRK